LLANVAMLMTMTDTRTDKASNKKY